MSKAVIAGLGLTAIGVLAVVTALGLWDFSGGAQASHSPGSISVLAIDMDTTGNTIDAATDSTGNTTADQEQTSLGTLENCGQITGTGTLNIDIVVTDWPANGDQLIGYDITLNYDPAVVKVASANLGIAPGILPVTLISADPQSGGFGSYAAISDTTPDTDGAFATAVIDLAGLYGDSGTSGGNDNLVIDGNEEDVDGGEVSPGFLARITLQGVAAGQSVLNLTTESNYILTEQVLGSFVPVTTVQIADVSVDQACVPSTAAANVQIISLDCSSNPEEVRIGNLGTSPQDLTGWELRSEPADLVFDLSTISAPLQGQIDPGVEVAIQSNSNAPQFPAILWDNNEKFRDGDTSDFARIVNGAGAEVDRVDCAPGPTPTPTPTPPPRATATATATPTSTPTPAPGAGTLPPTGDGVPLHSGSVMPAVLMGLGIVIVIAAAAYVGYGRARRRI